MPAGAFESGGLSLRLTALGMRRITGAPPRGSARAGPRPRAPAPEPPSPPTRRRRHPQAQLVPSSGAISTSLWDVFDPAELKQWLDEVGWRHRGNHCVWVPAGRVAPGAAATYRRLLLTPPWPPPAPRPRPSTWT